MKVISVGDVHLSDVAPVGRADDYPVSILTKLMEICDLAEASGAIVLFVGDIFHRRRFNDYRVISALIKLLKRAPCYGIYGNHDWDSRTQDIKGQPINVVFSSGAMQHLSPEGVVISREGVEVEVKGIDYKRKLDLEQIASLKWKADAVKILVLHYMILPTGTSFFGDFVTVDQIKTEADIVLIGHPHWDQGVVRHGKTIYVNYGALTRLYASEGARNVTVGSFDIKQGGLIEVAPIELKTAKSPDEVFIRKVEMVKDVSKPMLVESIVAAIGERKLVDLSTLEVPVELKEMVDHYLMLAKQEKM